MKEIGARRLLPPFSVVLVMVAMSVVGMVCLPRLNIQYTPTAAGQSLTVSFSLPDASAEIIEAETTSLIEGVLSRIHGVTDISSVSRKGSGSVTASFRKGTDMEAARFETASAIRNIYPSLPEGLSYPLVRRSSGQNSGAAAVSYTLKGPLPSREIERYARERILPAISRLKGVDGVTLSGATPYHWVITFDALRAGAVGISAREMASAIQAAFSNRVLGMTETPDGQMAVRISGKKRPDFGSIPVKNVEGQVLYIRDLATWRYEESLPRSYFRVNGLNTITLSISVSDDANLIQTARAIREEMFRLQTISPEEITASISYDASDYVRDELRKVILRTVLCVLILLLFVFVVSRSWRYLVIIASTLAVNILSALAVYALFDIRIHVYTLAGITVSLGIIIDTTIVMADHYSYWKDRHVFPALFAATSTTVSALLAILLLPDSERSNLTDFIWVVVINLAISLVVAYLFIPSLMELVPMASASGGASIRRHRRTVRGSLYYRRYIQWGLGHRWVYIAIFVLAFGIPTCLIPESFDWKAYQENRAGVDKWLSSSFGLFYKATERSNFYAQPVRKQLFIRAGMLEGCTVNQLNEVVKSMENYLAGFPEIQTFTTSIYSYDNASIVVDFKPEYVQTAFPLQLKSRVMDMAANFGGANWSVYGLDENGFNNNIVSYNKSNRISLTGYNYQELIRFAEVLMERLSRNRRVSGPEIWSPGYRGRPAMEFNLDYDFGAMTAAGINPYHYYGVLSSLLYDQPVGRIFSEGESTEVVLRSSDAESYDLWHVLNSPVQVDSLKMTLASVGNIVKKRSGIDIRRSNQSYQVNVCFDFIGSYEMSRKMVAEAVEFMNVQVLPLGYKAENPEGGWYQEHKERYAWLIFLIVCIIYVMLAMTFESFRLPLAVIFTIPISFIGPFLLFGLSDFPFDQGGFAAFVMLCGIVVNAGIYLVSTFQRFGGTSAKGQKDRTRLYVKAFIHKISPILLTVVSTVLGLIPFLTDGPEEIFWFDFAIGSIGGLIFSLIALLLYLPVFIIRKKDHDC